MNKIYVKPSVDTVWPSPLDPCDIEWKLRYGSLTDDERMIAASFVQAYKSLFGKSQKDVNRYLRDIKTFLGIKL